MIKQLYKFFLLSVASLFLFSCDDSDRPPHPIIDPFEDYDISDDILRGKVFYYINLNDLTEGDYLLETNEPVDFYTFGDRTGDDSLPLIVEDTEEGQTLSTKIPNGYGGERKVFPAYAVGRESGERRTVIFIIDNDVNNEEDTDLSDLSSQSPLFPAYGSFLGKGTLCYGSVGNNKSNVLLFKQLNLEDENLFTYSSVNSTTMDEIHEHSFESLMTKWGVNIGLSGSMGKGFSGGLNFGYEKESRSSKDYEYYMCYLKVQRTEMKLNTNELERMTTRNADDATQFLGFVARGFKEDVLSRCNEKFDTTGFYSLWGTDVITQGTLGGYNSFIFSREETSQQSHIGLDIKAYVQHKKDVEKDEKMGDWYNIYKDFSNDPSFKTSVGVTYQKDEYFTASRIKCNYYSVGGNATDGSSPKDWLAAFNDASQSDKWALIQYRTSSDIIKEGTDEWLLYKIEQMAQNVVDATNTVFEATGQMSHADSMLIFNARKNIAAIKDGRENFIKANRIIEKERTPLVLCDVKMVNSSSRRKSAEPQPFVAADPRDPNKMRTYYPMIANRFFDIKHNTKSMRGKPIDTNDDCFIASGHTTSHYWYYAMAHEDDCDGITDIRFLTEGEAHKDYPYYVRHGDHARHGLSGLLVKQRYVYIKYWDKALDSNNKKITAFGLWDSHSDYNKYDSSEKYKRVIASTGVVELLPDMTESEQKVVQSFWGASNIKPVDNTNQFYQGGGVIPHKIYPVFTTDPLPEDTLSNVKKSILTW